MKICFYGASQEVTGSSFLVETPDTRILIDCGMFQGSKAIRELNFGLFPFDPKSIDAVILTHAHIDHSGLIPKLIKNGYAGSIYTTQETIKLLSIMLPDSGHIQEMEIETKNRKRFRAGLPKLEPIYTAEEGLNAIQSFVPVKYEEIRSLSETISFHLFDAGHILGSAHIVLTVKEGNTTKKIVFSGDIGTDGQPYVEDPTKIEAVNYVVMETTYGDKLHIGKETRLDALAEVINSTYEKGGNVVIPAFAVERTQDILYYLQQLQSEKRIPVLPIYVDSPLAVAATRIFEQNTDNFDQESQNLIFGANNPLTMANLRFSETTEDSMRLNSINGGAIFISASGMADAGRIKHHLKHNLWRSNATVVFVGYQAEGTMGKRLLEGVQEVTIHGERIAVKARIVNLRGFSAHADQNELLDWVKAAGKYAQNIILIHGEGDAITTFSSLVEQNLGIKPLVPELGECLEFIDNNVISTKPENPWLKVLEEKVASTEHEATRVPIEQKFTGKKLSSPRRKVLLSEVSNAYSNVLKVLKNFVDKAKGEKDYQVLMDAFEEITGILNEMKKRIK